MVLTERKKQKANFAEVFRFSMWRKTFQCNNGECVKDDLTCDGDFACKDESDEDNCGCPSNKFACQDGKCIPATAVCDGNNDCSDGDDENNCRKFYINCTMLRKPR